jgi:hypothetical protein
VRISELKEILSYRGGFPSALQPQVGSESKLEIGSESKVQSAESITSALKPSVADRQQLRTAISNLSLCIDRAGDVDSPLSSPQTESAAGQGSARVSTATHHIIRALALEDISSCGPITNFTTALPYLFHSNVPGLEPNPSRTWSLPAACWQLPSNQKAAAVSSLRSVFLPASSQWSASSTS